MNTSSKQVLKIMTWAFVAIISQGRRSYVKKASPLHCDDHFDPFASASICCKISFSRSASSITLVPSSTTSYSCNSASSSFSHSGMSSAKIKYPGAIDIGFWADPRKLEGTLRQPSREQSKYLATHTVSWVTSRGLGQSKVHNCLFFFGTVCHAASLKVRTVRFVFFFLAFCQSELLHFCTEIIFINVAFAERVRNKLVVGWAG